MLTAFIAYPYAKEHHEFAAWLSAHLQELDVEVRDGSDLSAGKALNEELLSRIQSSNLLIAYVPGTEASRYVDQEIGVALGAHIPVVVITDGETLPAGLQDHKVHIDRSIGDLFVATSVLRTVNDIKKKLRMGAGPAISRNLPSSTIDQENWTPEVREALRSLAGQFEELAFGSIVDDCSRLKEEHPDCWRFWVAMSSALIHLRKYAEAARVIEDLIESFQDNSRALASAYQNSAWLASRTRTEESPEELEREIELHQKSLQKEPSLGTCLNLVNCYLAADRVTEAEAAFVRCLEDFPEALAELKSRVDVHGSKLVREIAKSNLLRALLFPSQLPNHDPEAK